MRCPICFTEGRRHSLVETRVPRRHPKPPSVRRYYDENDRLHIHDDEVRVLVYECSHGHNWRLEVMSRCPSEGCHWNNKAEVIAGRKGLPAAVPVEEKG